MAREIEKAGVPVDLLGIPYLRHPANLFKILRYLRQHRPALLHLQLEFSVILGSLAARLMGIPAVATLHTLDNPPAAARVTGATGQSLFALKHWCSRVLAVSESTRTHHLRDGGAPARTHPDALQRH